MVERLRSLSVEPPKGTESLTIHMVRVLSLWSSASGPLPLLSLMVEHPKGSLIVEYLKVLWSSASGPLPMVEPAYASLTVEPAYASLTVEPAYASLLVECANAP
jgi:hypothetical protein